MRRTFTLRAAVAALAVLCFAPVAFAAEGLLDASSVEVGAGTRVQMIRVAGHKDWNARWFASNGRHLSGYWDANLAFWRGSAHDNISGQHQYIAVAGLSPVLRYQRDDKLGWYAEGAIGVALFSRLYNNADNKLSTAFQFADHVGIGYVLPNKWDISARFQHYSNGGIKQPNGGVNFLVLRAAYRY